MAARKAGTKKSPNKRQMAPPKAGAPEPRTYDHPEAKTLLRPDVGTQAKVVEAMA